MITWSMLRTRRLQGTVRSTRNTGTVGRGRSRLETSRDGPRPLEAAVASDHALVTTVAHSATAPRRATEGRRKNHSKASACDSSPRAIAAAPLDVDALGVISCASNLLVSRSERRDPPAPTGTRPGRCPSRSNRTSPRHRRADLRSTEPASRVPDLRSSIRRGTYRLANRSHCLGAACTT
jgi:hypothetical protein